MPVMPWPFSEAQRHGEISAQLVPGGTTNRCVKKGAQRRRHGIRIEECHADVDFNGATITRQASFNGQVGSTLPSWD